MLFNQFVEDFNRKLHFGIKSSDYNLIFTGSESELLSKIQEAFQDEEIKVKIEKTNDDNFRIQIKCLSIDYDLILKLAQDYAYLSTHCNSNLNFVFSHNVIKAQKDRIIEEIRKAVSKQEED